MTQHPPPLPSDVTNPPSLVGPIMLTAFLTAALYSSPSVLAHLGPPSSGSCCWLNCCVSVVASTLCWVPVMLFARAGGQATPAIGCLIGLFGVGIGGIVGAIVQATFPAYDVTEIREQANQMYEETMKAVEAKGQEAPFTREEFVTSVVGMAPYVVILVVACSSVLAGAIGMFVASLSRRRPPHAGGPQQPVA